MRDRNKPRRIVKRSRANGCRHRDVHCEGAAGLALTAGAIAGVEQ
jgi:hypothetical protein